MAVPGPKKRRQIDDNRWPTGDETPEGTRETGLKLLDSLRRSQDKSGRLVSTQFLRLPAKIWTDTEYYKKTALPISFEQIQAKLEGLRYADMSGLESDLKRMVQNAKEYNTTGSMVYEDAERIRKALSNFMPKNNPAYRDQDYRALATPIPAGAGDMDLGNDMSDVSAVSGGLDTPSAPMTIKFRVNGSKSRRGGSRVKNEPEDAGMVDVGLRQQQLEVVEDMINLRDPEDDTVEITLEFFEKPSKREYPDYYQTISHPTALKDIQKSVSNNKFPDWESFITEAEFLWNNALDYNEEGSFIHDNANKLKDWFIDRISSIAEARDFVPAKKLTLLPPKQSKYPLARLPYSGTRIRFTNNNKEMADNGISVDEEARRRQQEHVQAASQGQPASSSSASAGPIRQSPNMDQVLTEADPVQPEPHRVLVRPPGNHSVVTANAPLQSPHGAPTGAPNATRIMTMNEVISAHDDAGALAEAQKAEPAVSTTVIHPPPQVQTTSALHTTVRAPGKSAADSLWYALFVATDKDQDLENPFVRTFEPSQHFTVNAVSHHVRESQAVLYLSLMLSEKCVQREKWRVVFSVGWEEKEQTMLEPGLIATKITVPLGMHILRVDVIAHVNDLGVPAPIWPEERFDFERFELHLHVHPDDW